MSGTTVTLRPTSSATNGAFTFGGGATTVQGATADELDGTYAQAAALAAADLSFGAFSMPAGAQIRTVIPKLRWSSSTPGALATLKVTFTGSAKAYAFTSGTKPPTGITDVTFAPASRTPDGDPWTAAVINRILLKYVAQPPIRLYRVELDVLYNEQPVVSNITPNGGSSTAQFLVDWDYTDPEGDAQERWRVKVFDDPLPAGFNPETSTARVDSGNAYIGASTQTSWLIPKALPPGGYWIAVKASDAGSNGRYSQWALTSVVLSGTPPASPKLLSVAADPVAGRVVIQVEQTDNLLTQGEFGGDEQTGGYLRWAAVSGFSAPAVVGGTGFGAGAGIQATASAATGSFRTPIGTRGRLVVGGRQYSISGVVKNSAAAGSAHLDAIWYNAAGTVVGSTSTGSTVTLATTFGTASSVIATAPATAAYVSLVWVFFGLTAAQVVTVDESGISEDLTATRYRGGLDSTNLLDPQDSTLQSTSLTGVSWSVVGTGSLAGVANANAYDGFEYQVAPGTVGGSHTLKLGNPILLPVVGGDPNANYQLQGQGRAAVGSNLKASVYFYFLDGNDQVVGAPVFGGTATLAGTTYSAVTASADAPNGATKLQIQLVLTGEAATSDRWGFDQFGIVRIPDNWFFTQPWKPSSQVDTYAIVEYSDDSGATWNLVRFTETSIYDPTNRQAFVFDYEVPPNTARLYRARTGARDYQIDPIAGAELTSAASSSLSVTLPVADFYVVDPYTQTRLLLPLVGDVSLSSALPQGEFEVLGRKYTITTSDAPKGERFTLRLAFNSAAEYDAFEAFRQSQHVLYIQTPAKRSWYVTLGSPRATTWGMGTMKDTAGGRFVVDVPAVEKARPV
jgi:hypothetical protein